MCPLPSWLVVAFASCPKTHVAVEMLLSVRTADLTPPLGLFMIYVKSSTVSLTLRSSLEGCANFLG